MPLTLITGPANSGKAGEVLGHLRSSFDREPLLVVPTYRDVLHYQRELTAAGTALGVRVVRFSQLIQEMAARAQVTESVVGPLQRELLLREAVEQVGLKTRGAVPASLCAGVGSLIAELRSSFVTPERFSEAVQIWESATVQLGVDAQDLAAVYRSYSELLEKLGLLDGELRTWRALDRLRNSPARWGSTPVFVYGFDEFTELEHDAIETLARVVDVEITVSLAYEAGRRVFAARAGSFERLRALAATHTVLEADDSSYAEAARRPLRLLERALFQFDSDSSSADPLPISNGVVSLLSGEDGLAELTAVAAQIDLLCSNGYAPEEIAVVYRSPDLHSSVIDHVFTRTGIPFTGDRTTAVTDIPLGRGFLALLRCALAPELATGDDLIAYLATPGLVKNSSLLDTLAATLKLHGIVDLPGALAQWEQIGWSVDLLDRIRTAAEQGSVPLLNELQYWLERLFALPGAERAEVFSEYGESDAQAFVALLAALNQLLKVAKAGKAASRVLAPQSVVELLSGLRTLAKPSSSTGVQVCDPLALRGRRYRALFLCGLNTGEFPATAEPNSLLDTAARTELAKSAGLVLPLPADRLARERYLFYAAVTRPTERLFLSYHRAARDGTVLARSSFLDEIERHLTLAEDLGGDFTYDGVDVEYVERDRDPSGSAAVERSPESTAVLHSDQVHVPSLARLFKDRESFAAGDLEKFASCPVKWFIEEVLDPRQFVPTSTALRLGELAHTVLQSVLSKLVDSSRGSKPLTLENLPAARTLLAEELDRHKQKLDLGDDLSLSAELTRLQVNLNRWLQLEAESAEANPFAPQLFELSFGTGTAHGPLTLESVGAPIQLSGRIDRVDTDSQTGSVAVRDYKLSRNSTQFPAAQWLPQTKLQVALYMLAMRRLLNLDPVAGTYQPLSAADQRPRGLLRDCPVTETAKGGYYVTNDYLGDGEFEALLAECEQLAVAAAEEMREGVLEPRPQTCCPSGCSYPGICRSA